MKKIILTCVLLLASINASAATVWIPDVNNPNGPWKKFEQVNIKFFGECYIKFVTLDGKTIRSTRYVAQE